MKHPRMDTNETTGYCLIRFCPRGLDLIRFTLKLAHIPSLKGFTDRI